MLSPSGRVLHAEGDGRDADAAEALHEGARRMDAARVRASGRGEEALEVWQGLISGRWSLVEQFDVDGKRFLLAHRNPEDVRERRSSIRTPCTATWLA